MQSSSAQANAVARHESWPPHVSACRIAAAPSTVIYCGHFPALLTAISLADLPAKEDKDSKGPDEEVQRWTAKLLFA